MQHVYFSRQRHSTHRSDATAGSMLKESSGVCAQILRCRCLLRVAFRSPDNAAAGPINEIFVNAQPVTKAMVLYCERVCVSSDHKWVISSEKILTAAIYFGPARGMCVLILCLRALSMLLSAFGENLSSVCTHTHIIRVLFLFFCETGAHKITPLFLIILLPRLSLPHFHM